VSGAPLASSSIDILTSANAKQCITWSATGGLTTHIHTRTHTHTHSLSLSHTHTHTYIHTHMHTHTHTNTQTHTHTHTHTHTPPSLPQPHVAIFKVRSGEQYPPKNDWRLASDPLQQRLHRPVRVPPPHPNTPTPSLHQLNCCNGIPNPLTMDGEILIDTSLLAADNGAPIPLTMSGNILAGLVSMGLLVASVFCSSTMFTPSPHPLNSYAASGFQWPDYTKHAPGNEFGVTGWVAVMPVAVPGTNKVTVDLSMLNGATPTAVRYSMGAGGNGYFLNMSTSPPHNPHSTQSGRFCCGPTVDTSLMPCPPESCPIKASGRLSLPAVPFVASIKAGKCACIPPQQCDASE
jgi:hypothetical protein